MSADDLSSRDETPPEDPRRDGGASLAGRTIGSLRIDGLLGSGGMGEVYRGFHLKLQRPVAVKVLHRDRLASEEARGRLLREARVLAQLGHPGICQIHDLVEGPQGDLLVLELIEGTTLRSLAEKGLGEGEALELALRIATILAVAHRAHVVHRDLKPDNIMVSSSGEVKILDFGLARLERDGGDPTPAPERTARVAPETNAAEVDGPREADLRMTVTTRGSLVGTPRFMSPEQATGAPLTTASDVYSFGLVLQELLTGEPAYPRVRALELLARVARGETLPMRGVDPELVALVGDMTHLRPEQRPSAEEVAARLRRYMERPLRLRRRRIRNVALAVTLAVLAATVVVVSWLAVAARRAEERAAQRRDQAEGLLTFLLEDLRPRLEELGRLDVLDAAGERALDYFAAVPESELTGQELLARLRALETLVAVRLDRGRLQEALELARRARILAEGLLERSPGDPEAIEALAGMLSAEGTVLYSLETAPTEAVDRLGRALALQRRLAETEPERRRDVARAESDLSAALQAAGETEEALRAIDSAVVTLGELVATDGHDPSLRRQLADALAWQSTHREDLGNLAGALEARAANIALLEELREEAPDDVPLRHDLAVASSFAARLHRATGDPEAAFARGRRGIELLVGLVADDPDNATWARNLAVARGNLAADLSDAGRPAEALAVVRPGISDFERLLATREVADGDRQLGALRVREAAALLALGRLAEARETLGAARGILEPRRDEPGRALHLGTSWVLLGELEERAGDRAAAAAARSEAERLLAPLVEGTADHRVHASWNRLQRGLAGTGAAPRGDGPG